MRQMLIFQMSYHVSSVFCNRCQNPKLFYAHKYAMDGYLSCGYTNFMPQPLSGAGCIMFTGCLCENLVSMISPECINGFLSNLEEG